MSIKNQLEQAITTAVKGLGLKSSSLFKIEHPELETHGDYSTNVALALFGQIKKSGKEYKNSQVLAEAIKKELQKNQKLMALVSSLEVAPPGFINFKLKPKTFLKLLKEIISQGKNYGGSSKKIGKTMVIDYSAPNIAKRFSIGHLRSTIIGQTIYNLYKFLGWQTIGDNHLGDWGTQFGKMIVAIRKWAGKPVEKLSIDELEELYIKFHEEAEKEPELEDQARQAFKALEEKKEEERKMWQQLVDSSMREFQKVYDLLKVKIDVAIGESFYFYEDIMSEVIKEAKKKKIAKTSEGALVIPFPKDQFPPSLILKSDGATTYFTRDLAAIKYRREKWQPSLIIYEVGAEQSFHFKQLFWAAELLGWGKREQFVHIPHGLIRLDKGGKMSTRKGKTIKLEEVLEKTIEKAGKFNKNLKIAKAVGIGAVKYNDLKRSPTSGYTFDWKEMLSLEGNSGPYLQYTYARCHSVLVKSNKKALVDFKDQLSLNDEELAILRWAYRFPEFVLEAALRFSPNLICSYLFELAQRYNTFYNKHSILKAESKELKNLRLLLTSAVAQVLQNGLNLLGIEVVEKM